MLATPVLSFGELIASNIWISVAILFSRNVTMTAGHVLLMWIGEQITEKGIGNGISMIITVGILSSLPTTLGSVFSAAQLRFPRTGTVDIFLRSCPSAGSLC